MIVSIDTWPRTSRYPLVCVECLCLLFSFTLCEYIKYKLYLQGHFVRSLGKIGERDAENEVILLEHDVPHSKFSDEVLGCLPKETWTISATVSIYG